MSQEALYGIGGLIIGGGALLNWWFEMFSDSPYADLCRSIMDSTFDLGRNTIALIEPAIGASMLTGGMMMFTDKENLLATFLARGFFFFLAVAAIGLIPFRLPSPMYPEWQMEKRRQRRAQARGQELATNQKDTPTPSSHHPTVPSPHPDHTDPPIPSGSLPPRTRLRDDNPPSREMQPPTNGPRHSDN
ncbi:hypothetical protein [Actinomyces bowdenii]|uniref:Uncharacterized protein n=1 Tax=Actinomyces bowdenii TaxID=131109 RepID=A0A3P1V547_9ACTO|nr:hypothetical protein [Actinomyces bowdenii]RRD28928.1 hypothetical protein EII10_08800 [Actinomyces bowdenii]